MNKIEIKIWANPQGIAEVTRKLPSVIFTDEEKALFSPDSYDPITTPDFFSIFYARNSYVVSYHFYITGSKLNFRDARTILSIAIPRGYAIRMPSESGVQPLSDTDINLYKVFVELKKKYEDLVSQLNDINGLSDALAYTVPHWIDEYSAKLVIDDLQPLINIPGTTNAKGYVLWNDSSMLQQYLEDPVRMDFNGASLMLLLPTVAEQQYAAFLRPFVPVRAEPKYRPKYSVYFPAYKRDPIAIVYSLDETIEHTFEKPYSKPIHLNGKYSDHIQDWDIKKTSDNAGYNIGLQFEEQEFRREINVTFINLNNQSVKVKRVESWLIPSVGRIVTDDNGCWLVLRGAEIDSVAQITFSSNRKDYWIRDFSFSQDLINIRVEEVFYFDVPNLKKAIECKYHFSPEIYCSQNGLQWVSIDSRSTFRGDKHQYKVKLAESEEYEEAVFFMDQDFNSIELKRKPRTKLVISFKGEILIWLNADSNRSVTWQVATEANGESRGERNENNSVTLSKNELELPPFNGNNKKEICFTAPGFKTEYKYISAKSAKTEKLELEMQLVWWKKIQKIRLTYVLIGLLFGYILGCLLPLPFLSNSKGGQSQSTYPSYSKADSIPAGTTDDNDDTYGGASAFQDSVNLDEQDSKQPSEIEPSKESEESAISAKQDNSKKPDQPAPTPLVQEMSPELSAMMQKLKGIEFTHADLQKARKIAENAGQLQKHEQFFNDCEFALSVATSGKDRGADFVRKRLKQQHTLQDIQKEAILSVIEDDGIFNSDTKSYSTIKAMLDAYNNQ